MKTLSAADKGGFPAHTKSIFKQMLPSHQFYCLSSDAEDIPYMLPAQSMKGKGRKSLDSRTYNDQLLYEQLQNTVSFIKHKSWVMERVGSTGIHNRSFLNLCKLSTSLPEESPLNSRDGKISPHFHSACKSLLKTQQLPCM